MSASVLLRTRWFSPNLNKFNNLLLLRNMSAARPSVYVTRPDVQKEGLDLLRAKYDHSDFPIPLIVKSVTFVLSSTDIM